ncbi:DNA helicase-like protein [Salicola phage SCTP-2]|nr:DNA helicase-like protein [Salicola phage SCTP-2]
MSTATIKILDEVHAKVENLDPVTNNKCMEALKYMVPYRFHVTSFRLGRWDGSIRFFHKNGRTFINLLGEILPIIAKAGYEFEIEDHREDSYAFDPIDNDFFANYVWPEGHFKEGEPITLRDDQTEAANIFLKNRYCVQALATGFGKTILTAAICKKVEYYGRTLTIVPSKSLVEQTYDDMKLVGMDVGRYYGDVKELGHMHTISTWQSLMEVVDAYDDNPHILDSMMDNLKQVLVDECHQCKSKVLDSLMSKVFNHIPLRRGFTGTIPKEEFDAKTIISNLGEVQNVVTARELQEKGILARCHVLGVVTKTDKVFRSYDEENNYLKKDTERLDFLCDFTEKISKDGNTLILVNSVDAGIYLNDKIPDSTFVYGKTKIKERKSAYADVQKSNHSVIIATYQVAAVGINIPRIFNLVMVEAGKSFVRVIQTIGRGIRVAKDKDFVQIYDISSNSKYSKKHYKVRKDYYDEAEYPYDTIQGDYKKILTTIDKEQQDK